MAGLAAQAVAGDKAARRALYDAVAGPVFALVLIVRERATAEDLFQDVLEQMYRQLPAWRDEAPFGFWVRQIAMRRCLMHLRSPWQRARQAMSDLLPEAEPAAAGVSLPELIDLSLDRLSPTARAVLWLHDFEGMSHAEIGEAWGQTASFSVLQCRARTPRCAAASTRHRRKNARIRLHRWWRRRPGCCVERLDAAPAVRP